MRRHGPLCRALPLAAVIPTWVCPSAPRGENPFTEKTQDWSDEWEPCSFIFTRLSGASDYFPICGFGENLGAYYSYVSTGNPCRCASRATDGVLEDSTGGHSLDEIVDGASTTLFCTENAGRPDLWVKGVKVPLSCTTLNWREYTVTNTGGCWGCFGNAALNWFEGSTFTAARRRARPIPCASSIARIWGAARTSSTVFIPVPAAWPCATVPPTCSTTRSTFA